MQADAGFLNHVQAGPPLAQAFRMEAGPHRNTGRGQCDPFYSCVRGFGYSYFHTMIPLLMIALIAVATYILLNAPGNRLPRIPLNIVL